MEGTLRTADLVKCTHCTGGGGAWDREGEVANPSPHYWFADPKKTQFSCLGVTLGHVPEPKCHFSLPRTLRLLHQPFLLFIWGLATYSYSKWSCPEFQLSGADIWAVLHFSTVHRCLHLPFSFSWNDSAEACKERLRGQDSDLKACLTAHQRELSAKIICLLA